MYIFIQYYVCFVFFFFQAEDGIRDVAVTGVQTCALPISIARTRTTAVTLRRRITAQSARARRRGRQRLSHTPRRGVRDRDRSTGRGPRVLLDEVRARTSAR